MSGSYHANAEAKIQAVADSGQSGSNAPAHLDFYTKKNGVGPGAAPAQQMRIHSNGNVNIFDGDLIIGTSGHGIDFSATADGSTMSSELLDDYEEGLWTPSFTTSSGSVTINASYDKVTYTKIGRLVHVVGQVVVGINNPGGNLTIGGLPYAPGDYSDLAGRNFGLFMMYANGTGVPDGSSYYIIQARLTEGSTSFLCEGVKPHADGSIADWCGSGTDFFIDLTYVTTT